MFCTLYFSSHMSGERLLVPFESQGKGHVSTADQVPLVVINAAQNSLMNCNYVEMPILYISHKITLPAPCHVGG